MLALGGFAVALFREGASASLLNNGAWALLNILVFLPLIKAALPAKQVVAMPLPIKPVPIKRAV
jgi:hypothetical protein